MRTWTMGYLLLVGLLVVLVVGCTAKVGKKTHFQQGLEYFDSDDYEGAAHEFGLAVVENKAHHDALFNQGLSYLKAEEFDRAEVTYKAYLQSDPVHVKAHINLAFVYVGKGDLESAKKYFEQAIVLDETYAYPYSAYAQFLLQHRTTQANMQAKSLLSKATDVERRDSTAHYLLGVTQKRLGDNIAAKISFTKAVDYDAGNQPALVQLAHKISNGFRIDCYHIISVFHQNPYILQSINGRHLHLIKQSNCSLFCFPKVFNKYPTVFTQCGVLQDHLISMIQNRIDPGFYIIQISL